MSSTLNHNHISTGLAEPLPPPIRQTLGPEWVDACAKLGFNPNAEVLNVRLETPEETAARYAALDKQTKLEHKMREERNQQLDEALSWLLAVIAHGPDAIRNALDLCECCEYCRCRNA